MSRGAPSLRETQTWFADAVTEARADLDVLRREAAERLTAGPKMAPLERLAIYRHAYAARLVECLADDYPALRSTVGQDVFEELCRRYIARFPSGSPSLNAYGRRMATFCAEAGDLPAPAFLAELASLEWAVVEVIHAPSAPALTLAGLADVPVERWENARLEATPALRLLRGAYPVNPYYHAFRQGESLAVPAPAASAAAVYRSGPTIWRMDLTPPMLALLDALSSGRTLGASLEDATAALEGVPDEAALAKVMAWFREWVSGGLFVRVVFA